MNASRFAVCAVLVLTLVGAHAGAAPDDGDRPAQPQVNVGRQFVMNVQNVEANMFIPYGNAKQARQQLETQLNLQLTELDRICGLDEEQKKKLKLAAGLDLKRFFNDADLILKKYSAGKQDQEAWQNIWAEVQPLQMRMTVGLFGDDSFFFKTVRKILTSDQYEKYRLVIHDRQQFQYRAAIAVALTTVENRVPLRREQHLALEKLLIEETPQPAAFGQYDRQVVFCNLSRISAKVRPILDDRQWQQIQNPMNEGRGMEQFLVQRGLIAKPEPRAPQARVKRLVTSANVPADASQPVNRAEIAPEQEVR